MHRILYIFIAISGLLFSAPFVSPGQFQGKSSFTDGYSGALPKEKIVLFTDRTLYAVHENIFIKVNYLIENYLQKDEWSTVVYVELIQQDGHPVVQCKYHLSWKGADVSILIPEDIPSGVYYLKAYTRWMRNFQAEGYAYKPIKIINPFTDKTEYSPVPQDSLKSPGFKVVNSDTAFFCLTNQKIYHIREKVNISVFSGKATNFLGNASISIVKKGSNDFIMGYSGEDSLSLPMVKDVEFFPEPRGLSISGKITSKETGKEIPYANVELALPDKNSFFSGFISNDRGQFLFTFPWFEGAHDFYIEANKENLPLSLQIDSEFCLRPFSPGYLPFEQTESEEETAGEICANMEIDSTFRTFCTDTANKEKNNKIYKNFYGEPTKTIYTQKYIELPDLREFIFEMVPEFYIENQKKIPSLRMVKNTAFSEFPPLCLVDNIPVTDASAFLNIPVRKVEKIEIIDKPYIAGNLFFNGIIHVFSKTGDMGGIEIPKNSLFFNFGLYSFVRSAVLPDYTDRNINGRIPDRRNTLYWNPSVDLNQEREKTFNFYTADMKGEYEICIQGLSITGKRIVFRKTCFIVE